MIKNGRTGSGLGAAVLVCILAMSVARVAPAAETAESAADTSGARGGTVLMPILGSTPDTGFMFGGMLLRFFSLQDEFEDARSSVFSPIAIYTTKNQLMIFLGLSLVGDGNRNELNLVPRYIHFPDRFYGIGRGVDVDADEEEYTSESFAVDLRYRRRVWRHWRVGLDAKAMRHRLTDVTTGGMLDGGNIPGTAPTWLNSLGPAISLDSRDNTWAPVRGLWLQAGINFAGPALGADDTMDETVLDLRGYWTVGRKTVLAAQAMTARQTGEVPFFALKQLGGQTGLRGYRGGLYRDRTLALARVELRRSGLWGRLGAVAFAGMGDVAPSPGKLTVAGRLWTLGGGFRFLLDRTQRVNLRADIGAGNGDGGFFLSLGEAF